MVFGRLHSEEPHVLSQSEGSDGLNSDSERQKNSSFEIWY